MRGISHIAFLLSIVCIVSTGCLFKKQPFRGVTSYRDGRVYLKPGRYYNERPPYYRVGILPDGWSRLKTDARTITWYNAACECSISTDAYCGLSVEDRSLASLGGDLITAISDRRFSEERELTLDGRAAIRQLVEGSYNGVPTKVDLVVVRKGGCVFDFYLVSSREPAPEAIVDFESFFGGFEYR